LAEDITDVDQTDGPLVSIIIPTRNAAATLPRALESIRGQTYRNIEIIVVDNASSDGTPGLASTFPGVRVLTAGPERSSQVNVGMKGARGKYLYRIDQDFILEPSVVKEAVDACEQEHCDAILIHNTSDPTISFWSRVRKLERDCYVDSDLHVATRFFTREAFAKVGGFDEKLIAAEDYDLHNRLKRAGVRIGRIRAQELHVGEPRRLKDVVRKHIYYGTVLKEFLDRNPKRGWKQIAPLRMAYVRHWKDFLADPKVTLGFFLYQYVRYASASLGYLARWWQ
jgi:glycosyltransferase involved in cell wall biosynthesis